MCRLQVVYFGCGIRGHHTYMLEPGTKCCTSHVVAHIPHEKYPLYHLHTGCFPDEDDATKVKPVASYQLRAEDYPCTICSGVTGLEPEDEGRWVEPLESSHDPLLPEPSSVSNLPPNQFATTLYQSGFVSQPQVSGNEPLNLDLDFEPPFKPGIPQGPSAENPPGPPPVSRNIPDPFPYTAKEAGDISGALWRDNKHPLWLTLDNRLTPSGILIKPGTARTRTHESRKNQVLDWISKPWPLYTADEWTREYSMFDATVNGRMVLKPYLSLSESRKRERKLLIHVWRCSGMSKTEFIGLFKASQWYRHSDALRDWAYKWYWSQNRGNAEIPIPLGADGNATGEDYDEEENDGGKDFGGPSRYNTWHGQQQ
ncbi:hypothetical protein P280DRAFT_483344 [Massarina eburnea CBS 473.64]|uniref:Uncharacterized protein n=1 Tax=Massarina eburnea CBS 473.64 TaxID=1395130 RepID=A0A6A6RRW3_9PLEO|nr:hypothetical protein P280DRAFT_483344 [Massarina eburnea CBS 473.64]